MKKEIRTLVARAVIISRGKILAMKMRQASWYFLPGGHVGPEELVEKALKRELKEELGVTATKKVFIGAHDNHFSLLPGRHDHEIGLVFFTTISRLPRKSLEKHTAIDWLPLRKLARAPLLPKGLGPAILSWQRTGKAFWLVRSDK